MGGGFAVGPWDGVTLGAGVGTTLTAEGSAGCGVVSVGGKGQCSGGGEQSIWQRDFRVR
jgi:hypothetical protein